MRKLLDRSSWLTLEGKLERLVALGMARYQNDRVVSGEVLFKTK
jgi:hypothetical protein